MQDRKIYISETTYSKTNSMSIIYTNLTSYQLYLPMYIVNKKDKSRRNISTLFLTHLFPKHPFSTP